MWAGRGDQRRKDGRECAVTDDRVLFGTSRGSKGNGSNVFMHRGCIIISKSPLLSTQKVPLLQTEADSSECWLCRRSRGDLLSRHACYF